MSGFRLLTEPNGNAKTAKSLALGIETWIMHLAPAEVAIRDTDKIRTLCANASDGCRAACLFVSGRAEIFAKINAARVRRTHMYLDNRDEFMELLACEIERAVRLSESRGMRPVFRLNGTSDIVWERAHPVRGFVSIFHAFRDVTFYDYTKHAVRMNPNRPLPANYSLTFSRSESNQAQVERVLAWGGNVAVVFAGSLPVSYLGRPVVDATETDCRFLDPRGVVCGLKVKGHNGKADDSGFVVREAA